MNVGWAPQPAWIPSAQDTETGETWSKLGS